MKKIIIGITVMAAAGLAVFALMLRGDWFEEDIFPGVIAEPLPLDFTVEEQLWLKEHSRLKIGVIRDMPPYEEYSTALRRPEGIAAGYWEIVAARLKLEFKPVPIADWEEGAALLEQKKVDALSFVSGERAERLNLIASKPYIASSLGIFTNNYAAFINNLDDVVPQVIAIDRITSGHRMIISDTGHEYKIYPTAEAAIAAVGSGEVRFYIGDILRTKYMIEKYRLKNMRYIAPVVGSAYGFSWAAEPENRIFIRLIDKVLEQISTEQGLYIRYKWATESERSRKFWSNRYVRYLLWLLGGFALALAGVVYRSRTLRKRVLQLSQSQKMESLGRLAGGVAHDFNNMLAGIQGAAELILMKITPGEQKKIGKYADVIIKACRRASHLTSQLLVFSREKERRFEPLNFNELIQESILLLEHGMSKKIEIISRLHAKDSCVKANRDLIQNMVLNLGFNARDAMPSGGKLLIATRDAEISAEEVHNFLVKVRPGRYLELTVKDKGCGIAPENMNKIFEPFYTTKAVGKGTGLGLAAVYGIVVEHQGTIKVESSPRGTIFKIYFPLSDDVVCLEKEPVAPVPLKAKIMVVDDEKILSELLKDMLESLGCAVVSFNNPLEAADYYAAHPDFDAVMLDVLMPHLSGVELYYRLQKANPGLKAVFMSGYSKDTEVEKIVSGNSQSAFVKKPYNAAELGDKLRGLLESGKDS